MSKFFYITILVLSSYLLHAETAVIDGKEYECKKTTSTSVFECVVDSSPAYLVNSGFGHSIYYKDKEHFKVKTVSKFSDGANVLYEIGKFPGMGMGGGFTPKETYLTNKMVASAVVNNLTNFIDVPGIKNLVSEAQTELLNRIDPKKITVKSKDAGDFICESGPSRELTEQEKNIEITYNIKTKCDYYSCVDSNGNEALAFVPLQVGGFVSANLITLSPKGKENLFVENLSVESLDDDSKNKLLHDTVYDNNFSGYGNGFYAGVPSTNEETDSINEDDYLPKEILSRKNLFRSISAPGAKESLDYLAGLCTGDKIKDLLNKKEVIAKEMNDSIINENLAHLISMINGQVIGTLIPTANAGKYGCMYNGTYITPKAWAHLSYLKKLNTTPSSQYLTMAEVQDLFNKAKNMSDIPFGYKYDGCYARAHVMARRFESMGIPTEKVWIKGDLSVPGTDIRWNFHVAPVVTVLDPVDNKPKKFVIDPSLLDKAVPLDDWVSTMRPNVKGPIVKTTYPFPYNAALMERTAVALSSSEPYLPIESMKLTEEEKMKMANDTMVEYLKYVKKE